MNPETKEKLTAQATDAKNKAFAVATWCKEKIAATWKSGRKGKAICIGGATVILLVLMRCGGGESGVGKDWKYADEDFSNVFKSAKADEGAIYKFTPASYMNIRVVQATKKGNLVGYLPNSMGVSFDRMVWVETQKRYEDDEKLGAGFYIRRGSHEYEGIGGGEHTLARYVEVNDKGILEKIQKQIDEEKEAEAKAQLEAEGKPIAVDGPVKSLCGFEIGTTPNNAKKLFKQANWVGWERIAMSGELEKPFRYFTKASLEFDTNHPAGGKHLKWVCLKSEPAAKLKTVEENFEEVEAIVAMLEKKFGIKFEKNLERRDSSLKMSLLGYAWSSERSDDRIWQRIEVVCNGGEFTLTLTSSLISKNDEEKVKAQNKAPKLSADAGADRL